MTNLRRAERLRPAALIAGAAAYALAEAAAGLLVGRFFDWGRAEALLFLAFRPWLLLATAGAAMRFDWRSRAALYALVLGLAGLSQSLFLQALGGDPWAEMLRGWVAGAAVAAALDLLLQLGLRLGGRRGGWIVVVFAALLLLLPGALRPYEAIALGSTGARPSTERPRLLLMTGLPIVWGETGPFDPASRPAAAYRALQDEFDVRPLDHLDADSLGAGRLMLLAQPRMLEPRELAAIDRWVRGGGRALILADPDLVWPSRLPVGDIRRPPTASLLAPLLDHWGLRLEPQPDRRTVVTRLDDGRAVRRLVLAVPGRFVARGGSCRVQAGGLAAFCRIGRGRVLLLADADLLRDELWAAPHARGAERHARLSDNPLVLAHWLDRLDGIERQRVQRPVRWLDPSADRRRALLLGGLPILFALGAATVRLTRRR